MLNPNDDLHDKAMAISASLAPFRLVTSEMVLTELLNAFASRGKRLRQAVVALIAQVRGDSSISIIPQTSIQFENALTLYTQRPDQEWSHTDCSSFQIMQQLGITEARRISYTTLATPF